MTVLVLDNSVSMSWCFQDQGTPYSTAVLRALGEGTAVVPDLWFLEVANVTALAEQRGILGVADRARFLALLGRLRLQVDHTEPERIWGPVQRLALAHKLTAYDARYLELAGRMQLPLATTDRALLAAARRERVRVFKA